MAYEKSSNMDPITGAPGAHPVGTGVGAMMGGAAAGAAVGVMGGPVGVLAGAVAGGLGGKAVAEAVNPTVEEAYWRGNYTSEPYYEAGRPFEDYAPAYQLGWRWFTSHGGNFDDVENRLTTDWESNKENSRLTWPQAKHASHAAWNRIDSQSRGSGGTAPSSAQNWGNTDNTEIDNDKVIDVLNDLLESCRDGEYGFKTCAEYAKSTDLKIMLTRHSTECREAGEELQSLIRQFGGDPDEGGSVTGMLHRGWVSVRGTLSMHSDKAMLEECERGEDTAVARYRKALKENFPPAVRAVVERQAQGAQRNHDQVKAMRDSSTANH
jgi:uncharacterized protein (TIGR02284 family)